VAAITTKKNGRRSGADGPRRRRNLRRSAPGRLLSKVRFWCLILIAFRMVLRPCVKMNLYYFIACFYMNNLTESYIDGRINTTGYGQLYTI